MKEIDEINRRLKENFGTYQELPLFRVIWSENMYEVRDEIHETWRNDIISKVEVGPKLVRKYTYIYDRWIMEYREPDQVLNKVIKNGDGYECCWCFNKSDDKGYILPVYGACELIAISWLEKKGKKQYRTEKKDFEEHKRKLDKESQACFQEMFGNDTDHLDGRFREGSAVVIHRKN